MRNMNMLDTFSELTDRKIIVFDGECVLCSGFFHFVVKRDPKGMFNFIIAQSDLGEALYQHYGLKGDDYKTNLVIINGQLYQDLDALAAVLREIGGLWRLAAWVSYLPGPVKKFLYNRIARNRYSLFGRRDSCYMPTPELKARFLG